MLCFELCIGNASNQECHMDEKTNVTPGAFSGRDGETSESFAGANAASPSSPQDAKGFVPMNIFDDLWPEDDESLISQGKVAMAELFDAETENNVTPISAADLLSAPAPEPSTRVEPAGFRSISDFEQEFKNYGSESPVSEAATTMPAEAIKSDPPAQSAPAFVAEEKQPVSIDTSAPSKPVEERPVYDLPAVTAPVVSEPIVAEPVVAESVVTEPVVAEPVVAETVVTAPVVSEPVVTEPVIKEAIVAESVETAQATATESLFDYQPAAVEPVIEETVATAPVIEETTATAPVVDFAVKTEEVPEVAVPSDSAAAATAAAAAIAASRVATAGEDATAASRSAVVDFLRDADDAQASDANATDQFAAVSAPAVSTSAVSTPAVSAVQEPQILPNVAQVAMEGSPVPNAIEEEAVAEAREIEERKLALAAAQMGVTQADLQSDTVDEAPEEVEEEPIEQGISVITREATVLGDIITQGHIDIVGRVKGNIDAKGDVAIHGIVRGDVGGSKIGLYDCRVKGNLDAALGVIVDESSIIGGDVKTKNIIFDGKVKGNIDAENVVVLRSHSLTLGDVSAASLAVEPGAILNGTVRTLVDGDLEAPFEEVM
jgi:cytoskeletal protein CcmA (bactofilin family)